MPNYYGREGAPMIQPTKNTLRAIIHEQSETIFSLESTVNIEKAARQSAEKKLAVAAQLIGEQIIEQALKEAEATIIPDRSKPKSPIRRV